MRFTRKVSLGFITALGLFTGAAYANACEGCGRPEPAPIVHPPRRASFGVNLGSTAPWTSNIPFADAMKSAWPWRFVGQKNGDPAPTLDPEGYPVIGENDQVECWVLGPYHPTGDYALTYEGSAEITLVIRPKGRAEYAAPSKKTRPGRIVFSVTEQANAHLVLTKVDPQKPLKNLRLFLPKLERERSSFNPAWVAGLRAYSTLRFMDILATNNSPTISWDNRTTTSTLTYFKRGMPVELAIELANLTKTDPWINIPHKANDDYVRKFAQFAKTSLAPTQKIYLEYSNEVFNRAFTQHTYAVEQAKLRKYNADGVTNTRTLAARFSVQRSLEIFRIWREVFGTEQENRIVRVVTSAARDDGHLQSITDALEFKNAHTEVDALAYAPYFGLGVSKHFPKPSTEMTVDEVLDLLANDQATQIRAEHARIRSLAEKLGKTLLAYEGGQHISLFGDPISSAPEAEKKAFISLCAQANKHPRMADLYRQHFDDWFTNNGGLYCQWIYVAPSGNGFDWGLQEYIGQPPEQAPKLRAVLEYMSRPVESSTTSPSAP